MLGAENVWTEAFLKPAIAICHTETECVCSFRLRNDGDSARAVNRNGAVDWTWTETR